MIHGSHRSSEKWGLDEVRETIRRIKPDVVLCEIPPQRWPGVAETWNESKTILDQRVKRFPEYTDVLLPLMDELHFEVEGCAAWTAEMAASRQRAIAAFEGTAGADPEDAEALQAYRDADAWVSEWALKQGPDGDDPMVIHSRAYDHVTKGTLLPYDHWLNERIGLGGWTNINQAHYQLIEAALRKHQGKRVLITFGAGHKYWFLEQLRWDQSVKLIDVRPFLPGGATPRTPEQKVIEEVYAMAESNWRCFYDDGNRFMRPAMARIDASMSPRDAMTFINGLRRGTRGSTFLDQEWIGPVTVLSREEGAYQVRFPVLRALQAADEAPRASAVLVVDDKMAGGFRWTEIDWPR